jgi:putative flavoprotein involved in K+ transport
MDETINSVEIDTVVIGAGPAGLVAAYHLQRARVPFVVLDANGRVGDSWRARYDGLRLFSLPRYASLPGWRIPVRGFPTRDEMADYVEAYAARFDIPVRSGVQVRRVGRAGAGFTVETGTDTYACAKVVVAAGIHTRPVVPHLPVTSTPASRSCIRWNTATPASSRPAECWWWGQRTPAPTSRWRALRPDIPRGWPGGIPGSCR